MNVNRVDHISIAVHDLEAARRVWEPILGKETPDESYVDDAERIQVHRYWVGEVGLEIMASTTPDGPVARFLESHGEGIMLLSLNVDDAVGSAAELEAQAYRIAGPPRRFRAGRYTFLHPRSATGVLLELIDEGSGEDGA